MKTINFLSLSYRGIGNAVSASFKSRSRSSAKARVIVHSNKKLFLINMMLCTVVFSFLLLYVVSADSITANTYQLRLLNGKLGTIEAKYSEFTKLQTTHSSYSALLQFTQAHNMVKAQNIQYLFENKGVALRK